MLEDMIKKVTEAFDGENHKCVIEQDYQEGKKLYIVSELYTRGTEFFAFNGRVLFSTEELEY